MKKFINLCKKPFLIASTSVFALFFIMLIVLWSLPHGNKYVYEKNIAMADTSIKMVFEFKDGQIKATSQNYTNGQGQTIEESGEYKIEKGILYDVEGNTFTKVGKINAFTIKIDVDELMDILGMADEEMTVTDLNQLKTYMRLIYGKEIVMVCSLTTALRTTAIVFASIFGTIAVACLVLLILDKKGIIKYKEDKPDVEVDEVSSSLEEAVVETIETPNDTKTE